MNNAIDFSFYTNEKQQREQNEKQQEEQEQQQQELANADLLRQFRQFFAPIVDDSLQLYYQLNGAEQVDSDADVQHIRIHRTVAELNELTSSEEETLITQLNSPSPLPQPVDTPLPDLPTTPSGSSMSSTSSSCLYAIHTPSPAQRLESPQSVVSDAPLTITEQVQLHAPPHGDNNNVIDGFEDDPNSSSQNNNTSCSISSTLTDSKTLDGRTPIVV